MRMETIVALVMTVMLGTLLAAFPALAQDADGDGMPDAWEDAHACVDSATGDSLGDPDGDAMTSLAEYLYSDLMDPCASDTDGDSVSDHFDNCKVMPNPTQADAGWKASAGADSPTTWEW